MFSENLVKYSKLTSFVTSLPFSLPSSSIEFIDPPPAPPPSSPFLLIHETFFPSLLVIPCQVHHMVFGRLELNTWSYNCRILALDRSGTNLLILNNRIHFLTAKPPKNIVKRVMKLSFYIFAKYPRIFRTRISCEVPDISLISLTSHDSHQ